MSEVKNPFYGELKDVQEHSRFETKCLDQKNESDYRCRNCSEYCVEPVVASHCGHFYCKICLLLKYSRCGCDESQSGDSSFSETSGNIFKPFINVLKTVEGVCRDCSQLVVRGLNGEGYAQHVPQCPVECPYGCLSTSSRKQLYDHFLVCSR